MNLARQECTEFFAGSGDCLRVGLNEPNTHGRAPVALLPGSFNPVHAGHWGLAAAASRYLGVPVDFELSIHNVDKPALPAYIALQRTEQFAARGTVWLTRAPRFEQKARLFPGVVFVVGADTAARIVAARYYADASVGLEKALNQISDLGCRFLVAYRVDRAGHLVGLEDLEIPVAGAGLFQPLPAREFRLDLSSTELRVCQG
jgi:hypothetical protein